MTRPWDKLELRFASGRTTLLEVTDVSADCTYAVRWREDDRREDPVVFALYADGLVERQRWGTGRNAGEHRSSEELPGATWTAVSEVAV